MAAQPEWLEYMEHTADQGVVVLAASEEELFARAAWGMFSLIADMDTVAPRERVSVEVSATDREALLVRWLSELNFLHQTRHKLFSVFLVRLGSGCALRAEVRGESVDPQRHELAGELKAVTFHGLKVEQRGGRWEARVLFDV